MKKVIMVDNYDREGYLPSLIQDQLTESEAKALASKFNAQEDELSPDYYIVVDQDYPMEEE